MIIGHYIYDLASGTVTKLELPESVSVQKEEDRKNAICLFSITTEICDDETTLEDHRAQFNKEAKRGKKGVWYDWKNNYKHISTGNKQMCVPLKMSQEDVDIATLVLALDCYKEALEKELHSGYSAFIYVALQNGYFGGHYNKMTGKEFIRTFQIKVGASTFSEYKSYCKWDGEEKRIIIQKNNNALKLEKTANELIQGVRKMYKEMKDSLEVSISAENIESTGNLP